MAARSASHREHPLLRAVARRDVLVRHAGSAAGVLGGALAARALALTVPRSLTLAAGLAAAVLGLALLVAQMTVRDQALAALAAGEEGLVRQATARVAARLAGARSPTRLAAGLERALVQRYGMRPPIDRDALPAAWAHGERIAALLRHSGQTSLRAVARCERLLANGCDSPLHRGRMDALLRELGRIRYELEVAVEAA